MVPRRKTNKGFVKVFSKSSHSLNVGEIPFRSFLGTLASFERFLLRPLPTTVIPDALRSSPLMSLIAKFLYAP